MAAIDKILKIRPKNEIFSQKKTDNILRNSTKKVTKKGHRFYLLTGNS